MSGSRACILFQNVAATNEYRRPSTLGMLCPRSHRAGLRGKQIASPDEADHESAGDEEYGTSPAWFAERHDLNARGKEARAGAERCFRWRILLSQFAENTTIRALRSENTASSYAVC